MGTQAAGTPAMILNGARSLKDLQRGTRIVMPLPDGRNAIGVINVVQTAVTGAVRVGGSMEGEITGTFSLGDDAGEINGRLLLKTENIAYVILSSPGGTAIRQLPLAAVICYPFPAAPAQALKLQSSTAPQAAPPILSSRPNASTVLYLDFDGETVTDPDWPAYAADGITVTGSTIVAAPASLSSAEITAIWQRVKEDFWPFQIDVTTDLNRYNATPAGRRMRVIVTPTDAAAPGTGGIAYVGSMTLAGAPYSVFNNNVPVWVFNPGVNAIAEAISHELGHALGLRHDGRSPPAAGYSDATGEYYQGHGDPASAVGWAPIMGAGYYQNLVQWSKGEYPGANNHEDDVAIIAGQSPFDVGVVASNSIGYVSDEAGDTPDTAAVLDVSSGTLATSGIITTATDSDYYRFTLTSATTVDVNVTPSAATAKQANLDVGVELQDNAGNVVAGSNPASSLSATITANLPAGTYYVKIQGVGRVGAGGDYGYSNYGSIGQYNLTGSFTGITPMAPVFTQHPITRTTSGSPVVFSVNVTGAPPPVLRWQRLPAGGATWSDLTEGDGYSGTAAATLTVGNLSSQMHGDQFRCIATNPAGSATSNSATLSVVVAAPVIATHPASQIVTAGTSASFSVAVVGTQPLTYQWLKNGVNIVGATASTLTLANVTTASAGDYWLVASNTAGIAISNVARLTVHTLPVITSHPASQTVVSGSVARFTAAAAGIPSPTYQWQRNSVNIAGATSATLILVNATSADVGSYRIVASNAVGSVASENATLTIGDPGPAITHSGPTRRVFTPGEAMTFAVTATGTGTISYQWVHNGRVLPGSTGASYQVASVAPGDSGWYVVLVTDDTGTRRSSPVFVSVVPMPTQVRAWGANDNSVLTLPGGLSDVLSLSAGSGYALALNRNGTVVRWGYNGLGDGVVPAGLNNVVAISAGNQHSLALKGDGTIVGWGYNYYGAASVPTGLSDVVAISGGNNHSLALKSDGTVVGWGYNYSGEATAPAGLANVVGISAGTAYSLALKADGTVTAWGLNDYGQALVPANLNNVIQVAAGYMHALALKSDGTVVAWGRNHVGQAAVPAGLTNVVAVAAGYAYSVALKADGTVVAWGENTAGQTNVPDGLGGIIAVAAGPNTAFALRNAAGETAPVITVPPVSQGAADSQSVTFTVTATGVGQLTYQWRKNGAPIAGATERTHTMPEVSAADAGSYDVVVTNYIGSSTSSAATLTINPAPTVSALSAPRQVLAPGQNLSLSVTASGVGAITYQWTRNGQPIPGATASTYAVAGVTLAQSGWYHIYVTDNNGTKRSAAIFVQIAPDGTPIPARQLRGLYYYNDIVPGLTDVYSIASGTSHQLALRADGSVYAWGNNSEGQTAVPAGLASVVAVAAGGNCSMALKSDGTVQVWGHGANDTLRPPDGLNSVVAIAVSGNHALALKSDGVVVAWGANSTGQATVPSGLVDVVAISARGTYSLALKGNGKVVPWGALSSTSDNVPPTLANVIGIAAGDTHALALRKDGSVVSWGFYYQNQFTPTKVQPAYLGGVVAIATGVQNSFAVRGDGTVVGWGTLNDAQVNSLPELDKVLAASAGDNSYLFLRDASADAAPSISIQPAIQTLVETGTATWTAQVTGAGPRSYQWFKDGVAIPGATAATLNRQNISIADAGEYQLRVTNYKGDSTSAPATLNITPLPVLTYGSAPRQLITRGQSLNLVVSAVGNGPLTFQWTRNGRPINGATTPAYSVPNATPRVNGWYNLLVTDSNGTRRSATFFVRVAPPISQVRAVGVDPYYGLTNVPAGLTDVVDISSASTHALALRATGTVVGWGLNDSGQRDVPAGLANVVAISAGDQSSVALKADGTVSGWGVAGNPANLRDVVAVSAGRYHSMALKADGTVVVWGSSNNGVLNVPAGLSGVVGIVAGYDYSLALKNDGTAVLWGQNTYNNIRMPAGLTGMVQLCGNRFATLALREDGTVIGWGYDAYGTYTVPAAVVNPIAISAGSESLAALDDGSVIAWRGQDSTLVAIPQDIDRVFALAAGWVKFLVRDASTDSLPVIGKQPLSQSLVDGQSALLAVAVTGGGPYTYQWRKAGINIPGATNPELLFDYVRLNDAGTYDVIVTNPQGSTTSATATVTVKDAPTISALSVANQVLTSGDTLNLAVSATGSGLISYQWFFNGQAIAGATGQTYSPGSAGPEHSGWYVVAVTDANGTRYSRPMTVKVVPTVTQVITWGSNLNGQNVVPSGLTDAVDIDAGFQHVLVLKRNGSVIAWGDNSNGQRIVPANLGNVVAIAAGSQHSLALKADGTVAAWGTSSNGTTTVPAGLANVIAIDAGGGHSLALKADGTVVAWGNNDAGQCAVPGVLFNVVAVAAGADYSLALRRDGSVIGWGNTSVPAGLADVIAISAQNAHALALKRDGTVVAWGANYNNQANVPAGLSDGVSIAAAWDSSLVLKRDGRVAAWGAQVNASTPFPQTITNGLEVSGGWLFWLALIDPAPGTAPAITSQPAGQTAAVGRAVFYSVGAQGTGPLVYQWQVLRASGGGWTNTVDGPGFSGSHTFRLGIFGSTLVNHGDQYRCVVSNALGLATSAIATLGIVPPAGDLNADGKTDILWRNRITGAVGVWLMNGLAVTSYAAIGEVGLEYTLVAASDFNGDGKTDILWRNTNTGEVGVWLMNGLGVTSYVTIGNVGLELVLAGTGDFNGDGKTDILWRNTRSGEVGVWLMNGTTVNSYVPIAPLAAELAIAGTGDFNADGKIDILWRNANTGAVGVWLMNGTALSSSTSIGTVGPEFLLAGSGDYNLDGKTDILWRNNATGEVGAWLMNGTSVSSYAEIGAVGLELTIAGFGERRAPRRSLVDFNGDGKTDILWRNNATGDVGAWLMNGTTVSSYVPLGSVGTSWSIAGTGDVDEDGQADILWRNPANDVGVWYMRGTSVDHYASLGNVGPGWAIAGTADFDGDGETDILWRNTNTGDVGAWLINSTATRYVAIGTVGVSWTIAGTGDFDGDGKVDILWRDTTAGDVGVWRMNGTTVSGYTFIGSVGTGWAIAGTGDFNGDGKVDILWRDLATGDVGVWRMNGTTVSGYTPIGSVGLSWSIKN